MESDSVHVSAACRVTSLSLSIYIYIYTGHYLTEQLFFKNLSKTVTYNLYLPALINVDKYSFY